MAKWDPFLGIALFGMILEPKKYGFCPKSNGLSHFFYCVKLVCLLGLYRMLNDHEWWFFLETPSCLETNDVWRLSIALPVSRMPGKEIPSAQRGLWLPGWISYRTVSYHDPWGIQDEPGAIGLFFGLQRCSKGVVDVPLSFVVHIAFSL